MTTDKHNPYPALLRTLILFTLIAGVYVVLRPFLVALLWAAVLAVTFWPVNMYLRRRFSRWPEVAAASFLTTLLFSLLLGIVIPFSFELAADMKQLLLTIRQSSAGSEAFASSLNANFSWLVEYFKPLLEEGASAQQEAQRLLEEYQPQMLSVISFAARGVWGVLFNLGVTIFTCYFFFRYGDILGRQILIVSDYLGGRRYVNLVETIWKSTQGVVYGVAGAAICQGILAGIGYYFFGAPLPLALGALTTILGLIPFGPPLLYLPVALFMLLTGAPWSMVLGLVIWGVAVVSTVDNLFRPLFIYQSTRLPILLAFFGGLGGISAFGIAGLFAGPVILALAQTIWLNSIQTKQEGDIESPDSARIE